MIDFLVNIPLYIQLGLAFFGLNLLIVYISIQRGNAWYVFGCQGALAGLFFLLPLSGYTAMVFLIVTVVFFIVGLFANLILAVRTKLKPEQTAQQA